MHNIIATIATHIPLRHIFGVTGVRWLLRLLGVANVAITARLLSPADFGLMAQVLAITSLLSMFTSINIERALCSTNDLTKTHLDTVLTIKFLQHGSMFVVSLIIAGMLVWWNSDNTQMAELLVLCSTQWLFTGFISPSNYLLLQHNRYRDYALLHFTNKILQITVTLILAIKYHNVFALGAGMLMAGISFTVMSYLLCPYRPSLTLKHWRWCWQEGVPHATANIAHVVTNYLLLNSAPLLRDAHMIGVYSMAMRTADLGVSETLRPAATVLFPHLMQNGNKITAAQQKHIYWFFSIVAVLVVGAGIACTPLWLWLVGEQWREAVVALQWCIAAQGVHALNEILGSILQGMGYVRQQSLMQWLVVMTMMVLTVVLAPLYGWFGLCLAAMISGSMGVLMYYVVIYRAAGVKTVV